jgi:glycosyltransferase A (GT-A) superfamily protein (DUF2064 family)
MKHLLVMAKSPVPGRVKTRLCPPCSPREAAAVAAAALADTLDAVLACGADVKVVALAGPPGPWLPPGIELISQRGRDLATRLANAWHDTAGMSGGIGVQIGMDTPQVTAEELDEVLAMVPNRPAPAAVLGPATDGGWWSIGLAGADPDAVFAGIPMSTPTTGLAQHGRLRRLGLQVRRARLHRDIDTVDDLVAVTARMPADSRTARVAAGLLLPTQPALRAGVA